MASRLETAWGFARAGFYLFPCAPGAKKPAFDGWQEAATQDPEILAQWFGDADYNIGIHLGASGHMVVDLDLKNGKNGPASLFGLELVEGSLDETFEVTTPSGGRHLYFRGQVGNSSSKIGSGIDIRGVGGYVLAPGSSADGGTYKTSKSASIAEAPEWLLAAAGAPRERAADTQEAAVEHDLPENVERAGQWLYHAPPAVSGEGGNNRTFLTAQCVRDFGVSEFMCWSLMRDIYNPRCEPPWSDDELETLVSNAYAYAQIPAGRQGGWAAAGDPFAHIEARELERPTNPFWPYRRSELAALPTPIWQIEDVLPEHSLAMIWGKPESYKSFLALELALHIATGRAWNGAEVKQSPVLYLAGEGYRGIRQRVEGWEKVHGPVGDNFLLVPLMPAFKDDGACAKIAEVVTHFRPGLIVADTVAHAAVGWDENSATDMGAFMSRMNMLRLHGELTVLMIHHSTKTDQDERGSGAIRAAVDTSLHCKQEEKRHLTVTMVKQKDADTWTSARRYTLDVQDLGVDENSKPRSTLTLRPAHRHEMPTRADMLYQPLLSVLAQWPHDTADHTHVLAQLENELVDEETGVPRIHNLKDFFQRPKKWAHLQREIGALVSEWVGQVGYSRPDVWNCKAARERRDEWMKGIPDATN